MHEPQAMEFWLDEPFDPAPELKQPGDAGQLVVTESLCLCRRILDTFDHRLLSAGWLLAIDEGTAGRVCVLQDNTGQRWEREWSGDDPLFWRDLAPHFPVPLAELIDVRALLPRLELRGERKAWRLEGNDGAEALKLAIETLTARYGELERPLKPRLRVIPGDHHRPFRGFVAECRGRAGMRIAAETSYTEAVRLLGSDWPETAFRFPVIAEPRRRADSAVRSVLLALLQTMRLNEPGVIAATDTEFLHDYRVAVRRARSILGQTEGVFPTTATERLRQGLASLAQATSEARDFDVFLLALDGMEAGLPPPLRGQFEPLRELLATLAADRQRRLRDRLNSARHRRFLDAWERYLQRPAPVKPRAPLALTPVNELVGRRIWKLYRRLRREGKAIGPDSPPEHLHELRKTAKKLRYQMEMFQSLFPPDDLRPLLRRLKCLQSSLGDYQDLSVQCGHLRDLAGVLRERQAPTDALLSVGALIGQLLAREPELRGECSEQLAEFAAGKARRGFRRLFRPESGREPRRRH